MHEHPSPPTQPRFAAALSRRWQWMFLAVCTGLLGCQAVEPTPHFDAVRSLEEDRGGQDLVWERSPEDALLIAERVENLLVDGLQRDEAAELAVLNNRLLQAEYEDLGLAAADVLQAGLPSNPTVGGALLFPVSAGESSLRIMAWLSDLWLIPRRKGLAVLEARTTELEVARAVMATAHEAVLAWDELVVARQLRTIEHERQEDLRQRGDLIRQLYDQGLVPKTRWTRAHERYALQQVVVQESEHSIAEAEARLAIALSLENAADHVALNVTVQPSSASPLPLESLVSEGMSRRLDLMEARVAVELAARRIDLEHALVWRSVSIGVGYEGDFETIASDGRNPIGPAFAIEIPIFDQNQAGIAAADFGLRKAEKLLAAAYFGAREQMVTAHSAYQKTAEQLLVIDGELTDAVEIAERDASARRAVGEGDAFDTLDAAASRLALETLRLHKTREFNKHQLLLEKAILSG